MSLDQTRVAEIRRLQSEVNTHAWDAKRFRHALEFFQDNAGKEVDIGNGLQLCDAEFIKRWSQSILADASNTLDAPVADQREDER